MRLTEQFRFDHEAGDPDEVRATLDAFVRRSMGIELGAEVSVYVCEGCGNVQALFAYPTKTR